MLRTLHLILFLLVSFSVQAALYKGVDAEGNVTFSDKETPNAEEIPMPTPNIIKMPKPKPAEKIAEEDKGNYKSFSITQPKTNATLRASNGNVPVSLSLTPKLDTASGHKISIFVDGKAVIKGVTTLSVQLPNIDRGKHTISAAIKDKNNKTLISSNKVTLHLKRMSELHPTGQGTGPSNPDGSPINPGPNNPAFRPGPIIPAPKAPWGQSLKTLLCTNMVRYNNRQNILL